MVRCNRRALKRLCERGDSFLMWNCCVISFYDILEKVDVSTADISKTPTWTIQVDELQVLEEKCFNLVLWWTVPFKIEPVHMLGPVSCCIVLKLEDDVKTLFIPPKLKVFLKKLITSSSFERKLSDLYETSGTDFPAFHKIFIRHRAHVGPVIFCCFFLALSETWWRTCCFLKPQRT